jgi:TPR repeat protein
VLEALAVALCLGVFLPVPDMLTAQAPLTPEQSQLGKKIAAVVARAAAGDVRAQVALGVMYENGIDFSRDYSQALTWYQKAAAQGNHEAENNLGLIIRDTSRSVGQNGLILTHYTTGGKLT